MRKMTIVVEPEATDTPGEMSSFMQIELDQLDRLNARPVANCDSLAEASRWMQKRTTPASALLFQGDYLIAEILQDGKVIREPGNVYFDPEGMKSRYGFDLDGYLPAAAAMNQPFSLGGTFSWIGRLSQGFIRFEDVPYGDKLINANFSYTHKDSALKIDNIIFYDNHFDKGKIGPSKQIEELSMAVLTFCMNWFDAPANKVTLLKEEVSYMQARETLNFERKQEAAFQIARIDAEQSNESDKVTDLKRSIKALEGQFIFETIAHKSKGMSWEDLKTHDKKINSPGM